LISNAALNAGLNGISGTLLACGYVAIRTGKKDVHKAFMLSAFGASTLFLISYVIYHLREKKLVLFQGQGWIRPVYFTILISHTLLAATIVPLVLITLTRGLRGNFDRHRSIARWTYPLWLYVSVTGVVVYLLLYKVYPHG